MLLSLLALSVLLCPGGPHSPVPAKQTLIPTPVRRLVCLDEASASAALTGSAALLCAPSCSPAHLAQGKRLHEHNSSPRKERAEALLSSLSLFLCRWRCYFCYTKDNGARAKRSRAWPWLSTLEVQLLPKQLSCMVFGTGAKSNS